MNTALPTLNSTCTTRNLKMIAAVMCLTAVFVFTNLAGFAQNLSGNTSKKATTTNGKPETPDENASFINYKGITNPAEAKKAWMLDHPKEKRQATVATDVKAVKSETKSAEAVKTQVITKESAETIDNAVELQPAAQTEDKAKATPLAKTEKITTGATRANVKAEPKAVVNQKENFKSTSAAAGSSSIAGNQPAAGTQKTLFTKVKPYDQSTVVNDVNATSSKNAKIAYPAIPGFKATGDAGADAKAFEEAKIKLYESNRAEYNNYFTEKP